MTTRQYQSVQTIGFATGGMLGARVTDRLGIQTCWMTILRRMMALPTEPVEHVVELGIDDFAFRRGRKFGSILVNMQSHKVIDLLPDRKAETAKAWMKAHPEIKLVSRDRGGDYASCGFRREFAGFSRKFCSDDEHKDPSTHDRYSREVLQ